jgi:hypothetical protein
MEIEAYIPDFNDEEYKKQFIERMKDRVVFLEQKNLAAGTLNTLPDEALESIRNVLKCIEEE